MPTLLMICTKKVTDPMEQRPNATVVEATALSLLGAGKPVGIEALSL